MYGDRQILDRVETGSVSDAVVEQIERLIIFGVLKSRQKLPSERELSEQTGVSRPKVREAIKTLESRGLLHVQHGEGTFVSPLTGTALPPAMIDLFARYPEAFGGYLEFRREVEGFAAHAAALRATNEDRDVLKRILDDMAEAFGESDTKRELELDVEFHAYIVDATQNAMLIHIMASIYELLARGVLLGRNMEFLDTSRRTMLLQQHRSIGNAIINSDADAAAAAAEAHIDFVEASYREANNLEARTRIARKRRTLREASYATARRRGSIS